MLSLTNLSLLCRVLRHNLGAGLSVVEVFRQQAERAAPQVRPVAQRIHVALKSGESLTAAFDREQASFPPLFLALARVGDETGHVPEIFGEMEKYFALQHKLRRQFFSQSFLPAVQFVFALFIIAGLIFVLGLISAGRKEKPPSIFGLSGASGSLIFLVLSFGSLAGLYALFVSARRMLRYQARVDALLLRVPVLGSYLEAAALGRLALAMQLTLDSGIPIMQAMRLSLEASGNEAYKVHIPEVLAMLKKGKPLYLALPRVKPLPGEFLEMVAMGEEGGRLPELMRHQAEHYQEETARRLTALTRMANVIVWLIYAGFMIFAIFSIAQIYLGGLGI